MYRVTVSPILSAFAGLVLGATFLAPVVVGEEGVPPNADVREQEALATLQARLDAFDDAIARGDMGAAREVLRGAIAFAPGDQRVRTREEHFYGLLGSRGTATPTMTEQAQVAADLARIEARVALRLAEEAAIATDWDGARRHLDNARILLTQHPDALGEVELERVEMITDQVAHRTVEDAERARRDERDASQRVAQLQVREGIERDRSIFSTRMQRIVSVKQRGHYRVALNMARRLAADYPNEARAENLYQHLLDKVHEDKKLSLEERKKEVLKEIDRRIHDALVPTGIDKRPEFPSDWQRIQARSDEMVNEVEVPEWQLALENRLQERLAVEFIDIDPLEAMEFLGQRADINIVISPEIRSQPQSPLTLRAGSMRIDNALDWLSRQAGTSWGLRHGAVFVGDQSTGEALVHRIYDITSLLASRPNFEGSYAGSFQLGGDAGGADIFGGGFGDGEDDEGLAPEDIMDLIEQAVAPEVWDWDGYAMGIRNNRFLMVTASPRVHMLLQSFLRSQMNANQVLVSVELRWLELRDDFVQEIGVNWQNLGLLQIGNTNPAGYQQVWNTKSAVASVVNQLPGVAADLAPSLATGGLQLQLAYLGIQQVSAMITAAEQKQKGRVVRAIDVTCLAGQKASVTFATQSAYVSGYDVETGGGGAATYNPTIAVASEGMQLEVQPFVSSDFKYVDMDVKPVVSQLDFVQETLRTLAAPAEDVAFIAEFPIDLPSTQVNSAATRVRVPDGGTIMVGGFKEAVEQTAKAQVPFLGHIPYVGRLFGVRGEYSQRYRLYLTAKVRIILYEEEEEFQ